MKRPHIYGDEAKCRTLVARYIKGADELLVQGEAVKKRKATLKKGRPLEDFYVIDALSDWHKTFRQWFGRSRKGMSRYLQEQLEDVLPILALGLPPETGKPRHTVTVENAVDWLRDARDELEKFQAALLGSTVG